MSCKAALDATTIVPDASLSSSCSESSTSTYVDIRDGELEDVESPSHFPPSAAPKATATELFVQNLYEEEERKRALQSPQLLQTRRKTARPKYQCKATASDDEVDDVISDVSKRLAALGAAMAQELGSQRSNR
ncbi:hypothetical protein C8J56DRAFT_1170435 [Mycena floridula]|nr:hypothetical protein C8J56DRAFT_1170435 [Mycena floridula]